MTLKSSFCFQLFQQLFHLFQNFLFVAFSTYALLKTKLLKIVLTFQALEYGRIEDQFA